MSIKKKITALIFLVVITISSLAIYLVKNEENTFADQIITDASVNFKYSLNDFLFSASKSIAKLNLNLKHTQTDKMVSDSLNLYYSKMIMDDNYLKGIVLMHNNFSFIIYRDDQTWVTSYDFNLADSLVNWQRLNKKLEVISTWTDTYYSFLDADNLNKINKQLNSTNYIWRTSKSKMPYKGDLVSNIFRTSNSNGDKIIAGLIFSTSEMNNNFASVLKFEHPLVSIILSNDEIVTPYSTTDTSIISVYNTLIPPVKDLVDAWNKNQPKASQSYSFKKNDKIYWTRIDEIMPDIGVSGFAVTISASDLAKAEQVQELRYLYVSVLLLIITIIYSFVVFRNKRTNVSSLKDELILLPNKDIRRLIASGESEYVEFKSSLRWDFREEKVNKILEYVILKSIAAFANAKGGTLFIGVSDDLKIIGLEKDFNTLKKQDADYFELHLRNLITNVYGIAFSNENLLMTFPAFNGKTICSIQIKSSSTPVFLKSKNKQGTEIEKFYVRSGNASHEILSLKKMNEYIKIRFD